MKDMPMEQKVNEKKIKRPWLIGLSVWKSGNEIIIHEEALFYILFKTSSRFILLHDLLTGNPWKRDSFLRRVINTTYVYVVCETEVKFY